jgi:hypothetical protein
LQSAAGAEKSKEEEDRNSAPRLKQALFRIIEREAYNEERIVKRG